MVPKHFFTFGSITNLYIYIYILIIINNNNVKNSCNNFK